MSANKSTIAKGITQPHSKESYALVSAIQHWRPYLWGKKHYVTCHAALRYLYSMQNTSNMLTLWAIELQSYDVTVTHKPGKRHVPGTLSRLFAFEQKEEVAEQKLAPMTPSRYFLFCFLRREPKWVHTTRS